MSASIIAEVERTAAEVAAVTAALASAQLHRDDAVRQALTEGHTVAELMAPAGLSRERLYQIRDRRRGPRIN
jgi:hypothetical protein